jgi:hypothetical protein
MRRRAAAAEKQRKQRDGDRLQRSERSENVHAGGPSTSLRSDEEVAWFRSRRRSVGALLRPLPVGVGESRHVPRRATLADERTVNSGPQTILTAVDTNTLTAVVVENRTPFGEGESLHELTCVHVKVTPVGPNTRQSTVQFTVTIQLPRQSGRQAVDAIDGQSSVYRTLSV